MFEPSPVFPLEDKADSILSAEAEAFTVRAGTVDIGDDCLAESGREGP